MMPYTLVKASDVHESFVIEQVVNAPEIPQCYIYAHVINPAPGRNRFVTIVWKYPPHCAGMVAAYASGMLPSIPVTMASLSAPVDPSAMFTNLSILGGEPPSFYEDDPVIDLDDH